MPAHYWCAREADASHWSICLQPRCGVRLAVTVHSVPDWGVCPWANQVPASQPSSGDTSPQHSGYPCSLSGWKAKEKEAGKKGKVENMAGWGCIDIVEMWSYFKILIKAVYRRYWCTGGEVIWAELEGERGRQGLACKSGSVCED